MPTLSNPDAIVTLIGNSNFVVTPEFHQTDESTWVKFEYNVRSFIQETIEKYPELLGHVIVTKIGFATFVKRIISEFCIEIGEPFDNISFGWK